MLQPHSKWNAMRWRLQLISFVFAALSVLGIYIWAPEWLDRPKVVSIGVEVRLEPLRKVLVDSFSTVEAEGKKIQVQWMESCADAKVQGCLKIYSAKNSSEAKSESADSDSSKILRSPLRIQELFDQNLIPNRLLQDKSLPFLWKIPSLARVGSTTESTPEGPKGDSPLSTSVAADLGILEWVVLEAPSQETWGDLDFLWNPSFQLQLLEKAPSWNTPLKTLETSNLPANRKASALRVYTLSWLSGSSENSGLSKSRPSI